MKTLILHAHTKDDVLGNAIHRTLCGALAARGWETETKAAAELRVSPCVGCFNCWAKTPGICSSNDDGREIARARANCDAFIVLSRVTFGGYSSALKRAMERNLPNLWPLFIKVRGEMHHPQRYRRHGFLALGWQVEPDQESAEIFTRLAGRNALNMQSTVSGSLVLHGGQTPEDRRSQVEQLLSKLEEVHG